MFLYIPEQLTNDTIYMYLILCTGVPGHDKHPIYKCHCICKLQRSSQKYFPPGCSCLSACGPSLDAGWRLRKRPSLVPPPRLHPGQSDFEPQTTVREIDSVLGGPGLLKVMKRILGWLGQGPPSGAKTCGLKVAQRC